MHVPTILYIIYRKIAKGIREKTLTADKLLRLLNVTLPKDEDGKTRSKVYREMYYYNREGWVAHIRQGEKSKHLILLSSIEAIKEYFGISYDICFDKDAGVYTMRMDSKK